MVLRAALLLLALAGPAEAAGRSTRIAMAVALLDVADEYCSPLAVDRQARDTLFRHFREYDIAGVGSSIARPLNAFYEDFLHRAKQGRAAFCRDAPALARSAGYPAILAPE